jgi:hypothetical protein
MPGSGGRLANSANTAEVRADAGTGRAGYYVAALKPFWRYAVALDDRPDLPAIPYYRKAAALAFYDESRADLPWADTVLLKKRFRTVTVLRPQGASQKTVARG